MGQGSVTEFGTDSQFGGHEGGLRRGRRTMSRVLVFVGGFAAPGNEWPLTPIRRSARDRGWRTKYFNERLAFGPISTSAPITAYGPISALSEMRALGSTMAVG